MERLRESVDVSSLRVVAAVDVLDEVNDTATVAILIVIPTTAMHTFYFQQQLYFPHESNKFMSLNFILNWKMSKHKVSSKRTKEPKLSASGRKLLPSIVQYLI